MHHIWRDIQSGLSQGSVRSQSGLQSGLSQGLVLVGDYDRALGAGKNSYDSIKELGFREAPLFYNNSLLNMRPD